MCFMCSGHSVICDEFFSHPSGFGVLSEHKLTCWLQGPYTEEACPLNRPQTLPGDRTQLSCASLHVEEH